MTHKNTIRALRYYWKDFEDDIANLEIASGIPRLYEFNEKLEIIEKRDLGESSDIEDRIRRLNLN